MITYPTIRINSIRKARSIILLYMRIYIRSNSQLKTKHRHPQCDRTRKKELKKASSRRRGSQKEFKRGLVQRDDSTYDSKGSWQLCDTTRGIIRFSGTIILSEKTFATS